ncbi:hypothetical protein ONZ45_g9888 [Pleurotus djamor]|nr:hypothetical protein ONZ45_g9888 [Pleurotus djamor]
MSQYPTYGDGTPNWVNHQGRRDAFVGDARIQRPVHHAALVPGRLQVPLQGRLPDPALNHVAFDGNDGLYRFQDGFDDLPDDFSFLGALADASNQPRAPIGAQYAQVPPPTAHDTWTTPHSSGTRVIPATANRPTSCPTTSPPIYPAHATAVNPYLETTRATPARAAPAPKTVPIAESHSAPSRKRRSLVSLSSSKRHQPVKGSTAGGNQAIPLEAAGQPAIEADGSGDENDEGNQPRCILRLRLSLPWQNILLHPHYRPRLHPPNIHQLRTQPNHHEWIRNDSLNNNQLTLPASAISETKSLRTQLAQITTQSEELSKKKDAVQREKEELQRRVDEKMKQECEREGIELKAKLEEELNARLEKEREEMKSGVEVSRPGSSSLDGGEDGDEDMKGGDEGSREKWDKVVNADGDVVISSLAAPAAAGTGAAKPKTATPIMLEFFEKVLPSIPACRARVVIGLRSMLFSASSHVIYPPSASSPVLYQTVLFIYCIARSNVTFNFLSQHFRSCQHNNLVVNKLDSNEDIPQM